MQESEREIISSEGMKKLEEELSELNKERIAAVQAVAEGREHGDLRENAEYQSAREWQENVESKIAHLNFFIQHAEVVNINSLPKDGVIRFGSTVGLKTYDPEKIMKIQILGERESDFEKHKISVNSPLARALLGKKAGDVALVEAPSATKEYEILEVL